jgi:hypothetical protein
VTSAAKAAQEKFMLEQEAQWKAAPITREDLIQATRAVWASRGRNLSYEEEVRRWVEGQK